MREQEVGGDIGVVVCLCLVFHKELDFAALDLVVDIRHAYREQSDDFRAQRSHFIDRCSVHFEIIGIIVAFFRTVLHIKGLECPPVILVSGGVEELCGDEFVGSESGETVFAHRDLRDKVVGVDDVKDIVENGVSGLFDGLGIVVRALRGLEGVSIKIVAGERCAGLEDDLVVAEPVVQKAGGEVGRCSSAGEFGDPDLDLSGDVLRGKVLAQEIERLERRVVPAFGMKSDLVPSPR